ncbi:hypothetical protein HY285_00420 [Candidatus Peregrinibacteria bacterium]|nr:hypothetical protein [Candidatus Peregrinibacteria bacterium]MBI3815996.1 hypothetical protein [Candidatus Peregrinibacteria bacterium]
MINSLPLHTRQTLKSLGFTETECSLLLPLFTQKKMSVRELSKQTALSFDALHYALRALEKKKLVGLKKHDTVEVCSSQEFLAWIEEQKRVNAEVYDDAKSTLRTFLSSVAEATWKPEVIYYEGVEGIKAIYEDMLLEGKDIYGWRDIEKLHSALGTYVDEYIEKRIKKGIRTYGIMPRNPTNIEYSKKKRQLRNVRFSDHLTIEGEIRIYGSKVAVITFHGKRPVGFVFSGPITALFQGIFDHAWQCENARGSCRSLVGG